jgi:hypothetical protein
MNNRPSSPAIDPHGEYAWLQEGSLPRSREDRIVEAVAWMALVFALGAGLVIALLPVSAQAVPAALSLPDPGSVPTPTAAPAR